MTEITGNNARHERHLIDPVMFFIAIVLAPLVITALTFWILFVPVFALVLGAPFYLIIGIPLMLWWLSRHPPNPGEIAWLGFCANLVISAGMFVIAAAQGTRNPEEMTLFYLIFGSIFAPLWAWVFGTLYVKFRRPFFAQTV